MLRTLYSRLALVLFVLFCTVGGVFLLAALYSAHLYQQEVAQRLNLDLAAYIVDEHVLLEDGRVNQDGLEALFHDLMIINPSLEFYLLAADGKVLSYSAAPGKVVREQVDLAPLRSMLAGNATLPVLGDDPRNHERRKAFSAAPIVSAAGDVQGYIYTILGSEQVDHVTALLEHSLIMRWSVLAVGTALVLALLAGLLVFAWLTRRLRRLNSDMEAFRRQNFSAPVTPPAGNSGTGDEITRLGVSFYEMARLIHAQVEQLRETDSLRRELVANVSHDLRTPLASLRGYLETLALKDSELSGEQRREYLETASRHAERLTRLVFELFELAKLEARELKPNCEPFPLAELVQDVTQKFRLRAQQQGVTISVDAVPEAPFADADIGMIERVLDNLLDNALQHTPAGGEIRVAIEDEAGRISVRVMDTGSGIPASELPHIFERYYRKNPQQADSGSGAGLGLAIAQRIVELHGSNLSVSSALNKGSEFAFSLPAHRFSSA